MTTIRTGFAKAFINRLMIDGKKTVAQRAFDQALRIAKKKVRGAASCGEILGRAIEETRPMIEVREHSIGGRTYNVPMLVSRQRAAALAIRWCVAETRTGKGSISKRLARTLLRAYKGEACE